MLFLGKARTDLQKILTLSVVERVSSKLEIVPINKLMYDVKEEFKRYKAEQQRTALHSVQIELCGHYKNLSIYLPIYLDSEINFFQFFCF